MVTKENSFGESTGTQNPKITLDVVIFRRSGGSEGVDDVPGGGGRGGVNACGGGWMSSWSRCVKWSQRRRCYAVEVVRVGVLMGSDGAEVRQSRCRVAQ